MGMLAGGLIVSSHIPLAKHYSHDHMSPQGVLGNVVWLGNHILVTNIYSKMGRREA